MAVGDPAFILVCQHTHTIYLILYNNILVHNHILQCSILYTVVYYTKAYCTMFYQRISYYINSHTNLRIVEI